MNIRSSHWLGLVFLIHPVLQTPVSFARTCLFINPSSKGVIYADQIQEGLSQILKNQCNLEIFYLEERKNSDPTSLKAVSKSAKEWIDSKNADVIIISGDAGVENVMIPHLRDSKLPLVFTGVHGNLAQYGLPLSNSTGSTVKVVDDRTVLELKKAVPNLKTVAMIGEKNKINQELLLRAFKNQFTPYSVEIKPYFVENVEDFERKVKVAQSETQAIFWGSLGGLKGWDPRQAARFIKENAKVLTVASLTLAMPYSALGIVKDPHEYGAIAGRMAKKILNGASPSAIPITTNKEFKLYVNHALLDQVPFRLDSSFLLKAKKFDMKE